MGKIIIYHDGVQEEVEEEYIQIYDPFPEDEDDSEEYFELKEYAEGW